MEFQYELTILMPVLNEEETLRKCIQKSKQFLKEHNIKGEILISDNGSTDDSINICEQEKVRVVHAKNKGYGNALREGIKNANGKYIIFADSDDSYNFLEIYPILDKLRQGFDLVVGDRYKEKLEKNAMPFLHKYIGTQVISIMGRFIYNSNVKDFNCGLRGMVTKKVQELKLESSGMEFATEMIIKAEQANLKITNIPINYYKDSRINNKAHLNTFKDGIKHLKVIFFHKKKNGILKYLSIFIFMVIVLLAMLVGVTAIPYKYIERNMIKSAEYLNEKTDIEELISRRDYTFRHLYADATTLSIIYSSDGQEPLKNALISPHYTMNYRGKVHSLADQVANNLEANDEYLRYWHGNIIIVKILLIFFNIEQMYFLMKIIIYLLAIFTLIMLWKRYKKLSVVMGISLLAIYLPTVPTCLEYCWTFILMFIITMIGIKLNEKNKSSLGILFFLSGILTCFFDFFTNELLTVLIPILVIILLDYKNKQINSLKLCFIFVIKNSLLWFIGYCAMWVAKWAISAIVLDINVMELVLPKVLIRFNINDVGIPTRDFYTLGLYNNIHALYPLNIIKRISTVNYCIIAAIVPTLLIIDWKKVKKSKFAILLILIAITPYVRYLVIINHSFRHYFFTYRTQMITIIALLMLIILFKRSNIHIF